MKVICISGKARSGKDTSANILKELLESEGNRVVITHYADYLKFICKNYFGWNGIKDDEGRYMLQYVGTDVVRGIDEDFWVNKVKEVLFLFQNNFDYVLIPDTRFPNEIDEMKKDFDTISIRINRDYTELTDKAQHHSSETALDNYNFDFTVENNTTVDKLKQQITSLLQNIN